MEVSVYKSTNTIQRSQQECNICEYIILMLPFPNGRLLVYNDFQFWQSAHHYSVFNQCLLVFLILAACTFEKILTTEDKISGIR